MKVDQFFLILQVAHLLPLAIAGIRYHRMDPAYRPFILLLLLGFINESVNYLLIKKFGTNSVSFNIFHIVECSVLLYQFSVWGFFNDKRIYFALLISAAVAWTTENFLYSSIRFFNPYFRVLCAFLVEVIIANRIIYVVAEKTSIAKNAKFIICVGLIIVFMYRMVYEGALLADPVLTEASSKLIIKTMGFTDVFVHLLYAWAFLVAPGKFDLMWKHNR